MAMALTAVFLVVPADTQKTVDGLRKADPVQQSYPLGADGKCFSRRH